MTTLLLIGLAVLGLGLAAWLLIFGPVRQARASGLAVSAGDVIRVRLAGQPMHVLLAPLATARQYHLRLTAAQVWAHRSRGGRPDRLVTALALVRECRLPLQQAALEAADLAGTDPVCIVEDALLDSGHTTALPTLH